MSERKAKTDGLPDECAVGVKGFSTAWSIAKTVEIDLHVWVKLVWSWIVSAAADWGDLVLVLGHG